MTGLTFGFYYCLGTWVKWQRWRLKMVDLLGCLRFLLSSWIFRWYYSQLVPILLHRQGKYIYVSNSQLSLDCPIHVVHGSNQIKRFTGRGLKFLISLVFRHFCFVKSINPLAVYLQPCYFALVPQKRVKNWRCVQTRPETYRRGNFPRRQSSPWSRRRCPHFKKWLINLHSPVSTLAQ